ncbi:M23 family metallopeptidase [Runella slithyformis]|uniref:Peptidase M23 n=1 Tax=Runella slithyformis (strain ATCC 29530 / DSM 19594 / LMG 11500 / NCIMB 11436 / LSU 4) TaxID=761193 RepID=A0A7U3ZJN1_RUNSL|nr:M23 family metallopeptidase [Runella slithyformis]AEI48454.1 Peptidase M23 [Runella slithyformis DSM 19594]
MRFMLPAALANLRDDSCFTVGLTHTQGEVEVWPTATFKDESRLYGEPIRFTVVEKSPTLPWTDIVFDEKDFGRVKNGTKPHTGIDVMAVVDTEIRSAGRGVVHSYTSASASAFGALNPDKSGPAIWITYQDKDGQLYYLLYGHIASSYTGTTSYSITLKAGSTVEDGQVIGKVAPFSNSGKRADHLHIGVYKPLKKTNGTYYGPPTSGWGYGTISRSPEGEFISPNTFFGTVRLKVN